MLIAQGSTRTVPAAVRLDRECWHPGRSALDAGNGFNFQRRGRKSFRMSSMSARAVAASGPSLIVIAGSSRLVAIRVVQKPLRMRRTPEGRSRRTDAHHFDPSSARPSDRGSAHSAKTGPAGVSRPAPFVGQE